MVGRAKRVFWLFAVVSLLVPGMVQGQQNQRYRVLVPDFQPLEDADDDFGKDAAEELRELLASLATHQPIEKDEIEDDLDRFDMEMDELDCIRTRQLASQMNAQVALCASYTESEEEERTVNAAFWDIASGESFDVEETTVPKDDGDKIAAQHIFDSFDRYVQQTRYAAFCADYAGSQQWDNALTNCDRALELNPEAVSVRYQRARILYETERYEEALSELETVLELNQFNEDALQLAGYISALEGNDQEARDYYSRYLELNPADSGVRMRIAYDLAQAGDPRGAMQLVREGLDVDEANADLLEQYGGFAFAAALEVVQESNVGAEDSGGIPPEARELYREAIGAYEQVFEIKGEETAVGHLRNIIAAYIQLDELDRAVDVGERVLETHSQEDRLWSIYADALQRSDRLDEAIAALDRVREINPSHPNAALRQGNWLIAAGEMERAVEVLSEVAADDPQRAETAVRLIFQEAYQNGIQKDQYQQAIAGLSAAKQLPNLSSMWESQLNFWHAYALYTSAVAEQEPQTLETAEATLPKFQRALELFRQSEEYAASQPSITLAQFLENTNTYIEIQDAIIQRGR